MIRPSTLPLIALVAAAAGAQTQLDVKYGGSPAAFAGSSVAGGVDFNGDGFKDYVYGVPYADRNGKTNNGAVRVVDGQTGAILATKAGQNDADLLGSSVAIAGDVDDDGVNDFIAGAPNGLVNTFRSGYARVYSGADFTILHTLQGFTDGGDFGFSVSGRIDANLDGHHDLIVGAPLDGFTLAPEGKVHVFSGATGNLLTSLSGASGSGYGWSVANAGFVNADNRRDFIVGAPGHNGGAGRAVVVDGVTFGTIHDFLHLGGVDGFGWDVEGSFDVDADGIPELAVGAYLEGNGTVHVFDGATGAELTTFTGSGGSDWYGMSVARLGDIDGDGGDDLIVGTNADYVQVVSPARGGAILTLAGTGNTGFGAEVGYAGDVNADGLRDFLVGSPGATNLSGDFDAGAVELYSSGPWFVNYCTAGTSTSGCQASISGAGVPSATASSGFDLTVTGVEGDKSGLFFYGANGRQASPWGNGTSFQCVVPPVKRGAFQFKNGTSGACDGSFTEDLNARWCPSCPKPNHNFGVGSVVQAQFWFRDPASTSNQTTSISDALEFVIAP